MRLWRRCFGHTETSHAPTHGHTATPLTHRHTETDTDSDTDTDSGTGTGTDTDTDTGSDIEMDAQIHRQGERTRMLTDRRKSTHTGVMHARD